MRLKSYYLPEEITTNLYTAGKEWQTEDGVEYRGSYHRYLTNEVYTGATWNSKTSKKLQTYVAEVTRNLTYTTLKSRLKTNFIAPWSVTPVVNEQDRAVGSITRYFIKKVNENTIIEIDKLQYDALQGNALDPHMYISTTLQWYIAGPVNDEIVGVVTKQGVRSKNLAEIAFADRQLAGLKTLLANPLQFYTDTDYKVPPSIN